MRKKGRIYPKLLTDKSWRMQKFTLSVISVKLNLAKLAGIPLITDLLQRNFESAQTFTRSYWFSYPNKFYNYN